MISLGNIYIIILLYSDWTKRNFMTTKQFDQTTMLNKMHPSLFKKFAGKLKLNHKLHQTMNEKYMHNKTNTSKTPQHYAKNKEYLLLQGPMQPKPPSFFEQAYKGREDPRKALGL